MAMASLEANYPGTEPRRSPRLPSAGYHHPLLPMRVRRFPGDVPGEGGPGGGPLHVRSPCSLTARVERRGHAPRPRRAQRATP